VWVPRDWPFLVEAVRRIDLREGSLFVSDILGTGHRDHDGQDVGRSATANACAATSEID